MNNFCSNSILSAYLLELLFIYFNFFLFDNYKMIA